MEIAAIDRIGAATSDRDTGSHAQAKARAGSHLDA
jgi:hypothetical protein